MQPMSMALLERYVLSKPIFEREGLLVALQEGKPVGFVHGGGGPSGDRGTLSTECGVVSVAIFKPEADNAIAPELVSRCEAFLKSRGARTLYGGGRYPLSPFYYGLYGGSE